MREEGKEIWEKDSTCALYNKNECKLFFKYIYIGMAVINKVWKIAKTCRPLVLSNDLAV
jgi:hypothetical protein